MYKKSMKLKLKNGTVSMTTAKIEVLIRILLKRLLFSGGNELVGESTGENFGLWGGLSSSPKLWGGLS